MAAALRVVSTAPAEAQPAPAASEPKSLYEETSAEHGSTVTVETHGLALEVDRSVMRDARLVVALSKMARKGVSNQEWGEASIRAMEIVFGDLDALSDALEQSMGRGPEIGDLQSCFNDVMAALNPKNS